MSISAKELAQKLNVSAATISMVLNHKGGISPATVEKVLEGAREYGYDLSKYYLYNELTRNICFLNYKKSGLVVRDTPFFAEIAEGISNACKSKGINLSIDYIYGTAPIEPQLRDLSNTEFSGIILLGTEMEPEDFEPFKEIPCPIIVLDCYYDDIPFDTVLINNIQGAYNATGYLAKQGFTKIGYLKSSVRIANFNERADGYYKALRHYNIKKNPDYVLELSPSMEGAYADMKTQLATHIPLAEAYFVDNDGIASGAMKALQEAGVRIPEDVSLVGFDDIPICSFLNPPLTTMHVYKHEIGALAIDQLLNKINSSSRTPIKLQLTATLVERESVKKTN